MGGESRVVRSEKSTGPKLGGSVLTRQVNKYTLMCVRVRIHILLGQRGGWPITSGTRSDGWAGVCDRLSRVSDTPTDAHVWVLETTDGEFHDGNDTRTAYRAD
jgi:hypothetical protein